MQTIYTLANQVRTMRNAQKLYFQSIAHAKKTKLPADFATATNALKRSKELEEQVDNSLLELTNTVQLNQSIS